MSEKIKQSCTIQLFGGNYVTVWPNIGQLAKIESLKQSLTNGEYANMVQASRNPVTNYALDSVDAASCFSVLYPKLARDVAESNDGKTLFDLPLNLANQMVEVYRKVFWPWYEQVLKTLSIEVGEVDEKKDTPADQPD
jgi:hypothetical protein